MPSYLTDRELAERWGVGRSTLATWRHENRGPAWTKLGALVRYHLDSVLEFERTNRRKPSPF